MYTYGIQIFLTNFFDEFIRWIFSMYFFDEYFPDEFFRWIFWTNEFFRQIFYLLTIASSRIGVTFDLVFFNFWKNKLVTALKSYMKHIYFFFWKSLKKLKKLVFLGLNFSYLHCTVLYPLYSACKNFQSSKISNQYFVSKLKSDTTKPIYSNSDI